MAEGCSGNCGSCSSGAECGHTKVAECMNRIKNKYFVLSGKGGVGKSSVAALLAVSLARAGRRVGLLDVDFHGPSQPTLFGVTDARLEPGSSENTISPLDVAGVKLVSIGLLLESSDQAVIWRGPAKMGVLEQLLSVVEWGELDDLVLDFPALVSEFVHGAAHCEAPGGDAAQPEFRLAAGVKMHQRRDGGIGRAHV